MNLQNFESLLASYTTAAERVAGLRRDLVEAEEQRRKELTLAAMEMVANGALNPLTSKPHSWTSATEAVKDTALADTIRTENARGRYNLEMAEIASRAAWATVQFAVRPIYADG